MGCCHSSPYSNRVYRDPGDLDECYEGEGETQQDANEDTTTRKRAFQQTRAFGVIRNNSNVMPNDLGALPNAFINTHLARVPEECLYDGEIDQGKAFECLRPTLVCLLLPPCWVLLASSGISTVLGLCNCDRACCWVRKEYASRTYIRIYSNRIEVNQPTVRIPFGWFGCGSWNADSIAAHPFDRGAFGFRPVLSFSLAYLCCCLPIYGRAVARQRCECNGSLWPRLCSDCRGCWCDEW
jgi:hypothetical protein